MRGFENSLPMALLSARESIMAFFRPHLNAEGLTEQQWRVIRVLRERQDLEFHQLATLCRILPPSLSGILTRLERMRLVRRRKPASDQRRLHVALTRDGSARFDQCSQRMEQVYRDIEKQFGKRRLATLFAHLRAVRLLEPAPARRARKDRVKIKEH